MGRRMGRWPEGRGEEGRGEKERGEGGRERKRKEARARDVRYVGAAARAAGLATTPTCPAHLHVVADSLLDEGGVGVPPAVRGQGAPPVPVHPHARLRLLRTAHGDV